MRTKCAPRARSKGVHALPHADAIVLNWMALHDDVGRFTTVLPSRGLGGSIDNLIAFAPIRPTPT